MKLNEDGLSVRTSQDPKRFEETKCKETFRHQNMVGTRTSSMSIKEWDYIEWSKHIIHLLQCMQKWWLDVDWFILKERLEQHNTILGFSVTTVSSQLSKIIGVAGLALPCPLNKFNLLELSRTRASSDN